MIRFVMPIILIGISIAVFFTFTNPIYKDVGKLRERVKDYDQALDNSKALENARDLLTTKKNAMNPDDLAKIEKLLPANVENILLILEIEQIAMPYGMALKDVKYSATDTPKEAAGSVKSSLASAEAAEVKSGGAALGPFKGYGVWDLEFSTTGTYNNFLNFTRDLEKNLRIVDISSIQFSSDASATGGSVSKSASGSASAPLPASPESYKYDFKIKTYWLKN